MFSLLPHKRTHENELEKTGVPKVKTKPTKITANYVAYEAHGAQLKCKGIFLQLL